VTDLAAQVPGSLETAAAIPAIAHSGCYTKSGLSAEFRQGEIIGGLIEIRSSLNSDEQQLVEHEYAILVTQDCDLERVHSSKTNKSASPLHNLMFILLDRLIKLD
jgi:hypothetical protein